ncbi:ATP-binding protein [Saccharophagus degradans]|uniref:ATP-binding protein n=1 Tax=Saccharophagus degradans TaxID=86304 RepID=UPI001C082720|nr:ATP-binding protein [Saccharophagus degradans]MBU2983718.1 ATP-binding protein [Saccharophagus degradans]
MGITISVPERFEKDTIGPLFSELDKHSNEYDVCIDFSKLRYSYPTSMLVAGSKLRDWVDARVQKGLIQRRKGINSGINCHSYLMHLGFFDFIYMGEGNAVGEARGSSSYLPITRISRPSFDPFDQSISDWYEAIQSESKKLATVLSGNNQEALTLFTYSIREIIRNVFEHSRATECYICGQRWWNGKVEVAIVDEGIGVAATLKEAYEVKNDNLALEMAITPGVSRVSSKSESANLFDNSGFGLYILSEIAAKYGWYTLGSCTGRLIGWEEFRNYDTFNFNGTFFGMQINKPVQDFSSTLKEIIRAGEKQSSKSGIEKKASGASKLIEF